MGRLQTIEDNAFEVTRQLPQRHTITRRFRGAKFKKATQRLLEALYALEWDHFESIADFEYVEHLTGLAIEAVALHVVTTYAERHDSECRFFADMIERLRAAKDAVHHGLPPNPAKHVSQDELEAESESRLLMVMRRHESARDMTPPRRARVAAE